MTTQKAQSKIKTSTIAITILSVLLAVAVASTIVLAAFSATKNATTTITFGGNLTLTLDTAESTDFTSSTENDTLTIKPMQDKGADKKFTGAVTIPAIKAAVNMDAYIGYKISVEVKDRATPANTVEMEYANKVFSSKNALGSSSDKLKITVTPTSTFAAGTGNGVFNNTVSGAMNASTSTANIIDSIVITVDNDNYAAIAGYTITINIKFIAADAGSTDGSSTVSDYNYSA